MALAEFRNSKIGEFLQHGRSSCPGMRWIISAASAGYDEKSMQAWGADAGTSVFTTGYGLLLTYSNMLVALLCYCNARQFHLPIFKFTVIHLRLVLVPCIAYSALVLFYCNMCLRESMYYNVTQRRMLGRNGHNYKGFCSRTPHASKNTHFCADKHNLRRALKHAQKLP